jgi:hypothetical protein
MIELSGDSRGGDAEGAHDPTMLLLGIMMTLRPAIFDDYIVAVNITDFVQSFSECGREVRTRVADPWFRKPAPGMAG